MKVVVTGADGFLGWHTRVRMRAVTDLDVVAVAESDWGRLGELVTGADAVVHLAGINRDTDEQVEFGNVRLAEELANAIRADIAATGAQRGPTVIYSNTIHAGQDNPYGRGKAAAAAVLADAAAGWGASAVDVRFPNLFGEGGRPAYNSFVATFVDAVAADRAPSTVDDRDIELLHVQGAAQVLIDAITRPEQVVRPAGHPTSVRDVLDRLVSYRATYRGGEFPDLSSQFDVDLFNTLRARLFPTEYPIVLTGHSDPRGRLVETVRCHGGPGQTFVSTTRPGITRGEHYHLRKVERFAVVAGRARISLRKVLGDDIVSFDVSGDEPAVVDMPTLWVHNISNIGDCELTTVFWTNELYDPQSPDTYFEKVAPEGSSA